MGSWEQTAQERSKWRGLINKGAALYEYEGKRICEAERKRRERTAKTNGPPADSMSLTCSTCNVTIVLDMIYYRKPEYVQYILMTVVCLGCQCRTKVQQIQFALLCAYICKVSREDSVNTERIVDLLSKLGKYHLYK